MLAQTYYHLIWFSVSAPYVTSSSSSARSSCAVYQSHPLRIFSILLVAHPSITLTFVATSSWHGVRHLLLPRLVLAPLSALTHHHSSAKFILIFAAVYCGVINENVKEILAVVVVCTLGSCRDMVLIEQTLKYE